MKFGVTIIECIVLIQGPHMLMRMARARLNIYSDTFRVKNIAILKVDQIGEMWHKSK